MLIVAPQQLKGFQQNMEIHVKHIKFNNMHIGNTNVLKQATQFQKQ